MMNSRRLDEEENKMINEMLTQVFQARNQGANYQQVTCKMLNA